MRKYCEPCDKARRTEQIRQATRKDQNIRSWRSRDGTQLEAPIVRAHIFKKVVFDHSFAASHSVLRPTEKIGTLLDRLIGICFATPAYLRRTYAQRHIALLNELKDFSIRRYGWQGSPRVCKVAELPIDEIGIALRDWIFSFFAKDQLPLMPSYALDTARFIQFHIEGHFGHDPEWWEIKPMVDISQSGRDPFRFLDPQFKKEFTERMGTLRLSARVPENCKVTDGNGNDTLMAGVEFLFNTTRCHLSSGIYDHTSLACEEASDLRFDLHREFRFMGAAFVFRKPGRGEYEFPTKKALGDLSAIEALRGLHMELPAYWIENVIDLSDEYAFDAAARPPQALELPHWEAELD
jgi:hypothetical protein